MGAWPRLRSWTLQEPQIERREHQDNPDVPDQPRPELVPEEQDVHTDHDSHQREHVKNDGCLPSHRFVLLGATEWSKSDSQHGMSAQRRRASPAGLGAGGKENCGVSQTDSFSPGSHINVTVRLHEQPNAYHFGCFDTFSMKS